MEVNFYTLGFPNPDLALYRQGQQRLDEKDFDGALQCFHDFLKAHPEVAALTWRAIAQVYRRRLAERDPHVVRQLALLPEDLRAQAEAAYRQSLQCNPRYPLALLGLAQSTRCLQEKADLLRRAFAEQPELATGLALVQALELVERHEEALQVCQELERFPDPGRRALRRSAVLLERLGKAESARQIRRKLSEPNLERQSRTPLAVQETETGWSCPRCQAPVQEWPGCLNPSCPGCRQRLLWPRVTPESVWAVVANVVKSYHRGPLQEEMRGTARLAAGARVYVLGWMTDHLRVIGLDRFSRKYLVCVVRRDRLENFRLTRIYKPAVLQRLERPQDFTQEWAEQMLQMCANRDGEG